MSDSKWVTWGLFLALSIFPVYFGAMLIDTIVANSVEFWTGDNPINPSNISLARDNGSVITRDANGSVRARAADTDGEPTLIEGARVAAARGTGAHRVHRTPSPAACAPRGSLRLW